VRPDCFPPRPAFPRSSFFCRAAANIPYSLVTQPLPWPFKNPGTPSFTLAVQINPRFSQFDQVRCPSAVGNKNPAVIFQRPASGPLRVRPISHFLLAISASSWQICCGVQCAARCSECQRFGLLRSRLVRSRRDCRNISPDRKRCGEARRTAPAWCSR